MPSLSWALYFLCFLFIFSLVPGDIYMYSVLEAECGGDRRNRDSAQ